MSNLERAFLPAISFGLSRGGDGLVTGDGNRALGWKNGASRDLERRKRWERDRRGINDAGWYTSHTFHGVFKRERALGSGPLNDAAE